MNLREPADVFVIHHSPASGRYDYDYDPNDARDAVRHWLKAKEISWNAGNCRRLMKGGDLALFKMGGSGLRQASGIYFGGWIQAPPTQRRNDGWTVRIDVDPALTRHLATHPIVGDDISEIVPPAYGSGIQHVKADGLEVLRRCLPATLFAMPRGLARLADERREEEGDPRFAILLRDDALEPLKRSVEREGEGNVDVGAGFELYWEALEQPVMLVWMSGSGAAPRFEAVGTFSVQRRRDLLEGLRLFGASNLWEEPVALDATKSLRAVASRRSSTLPTLVRLEGSLARMADRLFARAGSLPSRMTLGRAGEGILSDSCVYTIASIDKLMPAARKGRPFKEQENRRWVGAKASFDEATKQGHAFPILLGDARSCTRVLYWGVATDIVIRGGKTTYEVDRLRPVEGYRTPQELRLWSTGAFIQSNFIRPYAPCWTPHFLPDRVPPKGAMVPDVTFPDDVTTRDTVLEGAVKQVTVNAYERSAAARVRCLAVHGHRCAACDFDFEERYGAVGQGFIHVHHRVPVSSIGERYELDPERDLVPVCPNCHAMLHRREGDPFSVDELREMLRARD